MTVSLQLIQRVGMWGQQQAVASPACPNHSELCLWEPCPGVCTGTVLSLLQRERLEIKETFYPQASCIFFSTYSQEAEEPKVAPEYYWKCQTSSCACFSYCCLKVNNYHVRKPQRRLIFIPLPRHAPVPPPSLSSPAQPPDPLPPQSPHAV